jgi:thioredoxin 1
MPVEELKTAEQVQAFLDKNGGVAVVDCHATWCGPCKAIAPYVVEQSGVKNIPLIKVDVDQAAELSQAYKVKAMPTFLVVSGKWNNIVETVVGGGKPNVDKVYNAAVSAKK